MPSWVGRKEKSKWENQTTKDKSTEAAPDASTERLDHLGAALLGIFDQLGFQLEDGDFPYAEVVGRGVGARVVFSVKRGLEDGVGGGI